MNQDEINGLKREIQAIKDVLNYRVAMRKAKEKGLPAPAVLTLDENFQMYEDMTQEQLQEEKTQLQNLLLKVRYEQERHFSSTVVAPDSGISEELTGGTVRLDTIKVTYLKGPDSSSVTDTPRDCLIEDIKAAWSLIVLGGYKNAIIMVRYTKDSSDVCDRSLELLAKELSTVPATVESYLKFRVIAYPYGSGISNLTGKTPLLETYVNSFERISDSPLAEIDIQKGAYNVVMNDRKNLSQPIRVSNALDLCNAKWHGKFYAVFCLLKHSSYSDLNFNQLHESIVYQKNGEDTEEAIRAFTTTMKATPTGHRARLTEGADRLGQPINITWESIISTPENLEIFNRLLLVAKEMLEIVSNGTMPKTEYNEKVRRTVIDIVVYTALAITNRLFGAKPQREILVEESLFNEKDKDLPEEPEEIIGSGPLDYAFPEGVVIVGQRADEGEEGNAIEEIEDVVAGRKLGSSSSEEGTEAPFVDVEAKVNLNDRALYQLLGQIHDAMYVKAEVQGLKRKLDAEPGSDRVKLNRNKVIGVLSTGYRVEVFSIKIAATSQKIVEYYGTRKLKVLRYIQSSGRNSSFKVPDHTVPVVIEQEELKQMLLLFIAVFTNRV
eukprot:gene7894-8707_t